MRELKDTMNGIERIVFVKLDNEVIVKKSNLDLFVDMFKLRFLKERIIFLVNISLLEKYEERINNLILDGFNISYDKDCNLTLYDVYKYGGYLLIDYDDVNDSLKFANKYNLEIIIKKINKKDVKNINNIKYVM